MPSKSFNVTIDKKISSFKKTIFVDPDKSISIRSFIVGAISQNISTAKNVLESEDVFSTIKCLKKLGVVIKKTKSKSYLIYGKGLGSLFAKKNTKLNFGNSGTLARLLIGCILLPGQTTTQGVLPKVTLKMHSQAGVRSFTTEK